MTGVQTCALPIYENEENEDNEEKELLLSNPRKKKKIEKRKNHENILSDSNNKNEKMNLETKKGILPNIMLLRQICDFPDLNFENEKSNSKFHHYVRNQFYYRLEK